MSHAALAWILRRSEISSCIIGAQNPQQIVNNVRATAIELSQKDIAEIDTILNDHGVIRRRAISAQRSRVR